jgi:hypothetical protein
LAATIISFSGVSFPDLGGLGFLSPPEVALASAEALFISSFLEVASA